MTTAVQLVSQVSVLLVAKPNKTGITDRAVPSPVSVCVSLHGRPSVCHGVE